MEWLHVLVLIVVFGALLLLGVPVAFAIGIGTLVTMLLGMAANPALITVAQTMATGLDSFALLAIPFFILAGQLMNRGGIARRLIDFAKAVIGMLPGGLAYVHILASMLFGAISGSAVAAASAIGGVVGPRMVEEGYDRDFLGRGQHLLGDHRPGDSAFQHPHRLLAGVGWRVDRRPLPGGIFAGHPRRTVLDGRGGFLRGSDELPGGRRLPFR